MLFSHSCFVLWASRGQSLFCLSENLERRLSKNKLLINVEQMNENHILLLLICHMGISCLPKSKWTDFGLIQWINWKKNTKNHHQNVWMIRSGRMNHQKWFLTCVIILWDTLFHWDIDYRTQHRFGGKYGLSFRHVGFRFQWEIKVSTSSRQLNIQVWSSGGERGLKKGFESHPSNAIPKGWGGRFWVLPSATLSPSWENTEC